MDPRSILQLKQNPKVPDFHPGDTVRVMARVVEGDRERVQAFEGVVIRKRRGGVNSNFTVRRVAHGIGVERTFLLHSPRLESVLVVRVGRVRRAKLYYLRERVGRKARIRAGSRDRFEELTRQVLKAGGEPAEEAEEEAEETEAAAESVEAEAAEETEEAEAAEAETGIEAEAEESPEVVEEAEEPVAEAEAETAGEPEEEKAAE